MPSPRTVIEFHNDDRKVPLRDKNLLKVFILRIFVNQAKKLKSLSFIFCSDHKLLEINKKWLNHSDYTDIITFDLSEDKSEIIGEIYISIDRVKENAVSLDSSVRLELHRVIFHGILHLCGYKDKTVSEKKKMRQMEDELLLGYFL